mgnify:FL=1
MGRFYFCIFIVSKQLIVMKEIFRIFLLIYPLLFITSCEDSEEQLTIHGCFDSQALNYNPEASIDNNSCCYNCYDANSNYLIGEYCGNDVGNVIANGVSSDFIHLWSLNGEFVRPNTVGAVPAYDVSGYPIYGTLLYENISCGL